MRNCGDRLKALNLPEAVQHVGVPKAFRFARLTDFPGAVGDKAKHWLDTGTGPLLLCGASQRGKTHLAAAIVAAYVEQGGQGVDWYDPYEILLRVRETYQEGARDTESDVLRELVNRQLLVLDDLGAEKRTDFSLSTLFYVLKKRGDLERRSIVTTNLTVNEWLEIEPRLATRMHGWTKIEFAKGLTIQTPKDNRALDAERIAKIALIDAELRKLEVTHENIRRTPANAFATMAASLAGGMEAGREANKGRKVVVERAP
jgi:chromosomal replication initiation ATPase DnaA